VSSFARRLPPNAPCPSPRRGQFSCPEQWLAFQADAPFDGPHDNFRRAAGPGGRADRKNLVMNEFGNGFLLNALIGFALALLVSFAFVWYR